MIKVVLVGDSGVGKTCQILTAVNGSFPEEYIPTVSDNAVLGDDPKRLQIWDTAGQSDYDRLRPLSYPNAQVFLIEFSVVCRLSFESVTSRWIPEILHHCPGVALVLVGNKIDLRTDSSTLETLSVKGQTPVTKEEGEALASAIGAFRYVENSSRNKEGLNELLEAAAIASLASRSGTGGHGSKKSNSLKQSIAGIGQGLKGGVDGLVSILAPEQDGQSSIPSDKTFKSNIGFKVGDVSESKSSFTLFYEKEAEATPSDVVNISLSFSIKDDVDPFALGELSGSVKQILSLAMSRDFKYEIKSSMNTDSDGTKVYTLTMIWTDASAHQGLQKIFDFYNPRQFEVKLDLNQAPSVPSDDFIAFHLNVQTELSRNIALFFEGIFSKALTGDQKSLFTIFRAARSFSFELAFNDIQEVYKKAWNVPEELQLLGWSTIPQLILASPLGKILHSPDTPEPARSIYEKLSYLRGLHGAKFKFGNQAVKLTCSHLDIVSVLPSLAELNSGGDSD